MMQHAIFKTRLSNETKFLARVRLNECYGQDQLVYRMPEVGTSASRSDIQSNFFPVSTFSSILLTRQFSL